MRLFEFLNVGAAYAPSDADRRATAIKKAAEYSRAQWLRALVADQTLAWWHVGLEDRAVLSGTCVMLTIAGFAEVFDTRETDGADLRVLRGGISAITQCGDAGSVITVELARAISSACQRAEAIVRRATVEAIAHAAVSIRTAVGLSNLAAGGEQPFGLLSA